MGAGFEVSAARLSQLLAVDLPDAELLRVAAEPRHKLAVLLLSAWRREGRELDPADAARLAAYEHRAEEYRRVWDGLRPVAPGMRQVKGLEIADRYPAGLVRGAGDMDLTCADLDEVWRGASRLAGAGWTLNALTLLPAPAGPGVLVEFHRPADPPLTEPYGVELRTVDIATSLRRRLIRLRHPEQGVAKNIVALLAERWERAFRSRDVLDLAVLLPGLPDDGSLPAMLDETGLWPEWVELARKVAELGWLPPGAPPLDAGRRRRELVARHARDLAGWSHPVRALGTLAQRTVDGDRGPGWDRFADVVHRRVGVRRLLAAGLPVFGVPLDADDRADRLVLVCRGGHLVARTPVGSLLLVGGACQQDWLSESAAARR